MSISGSNQNAVLSKIGTCDIKSTAHKHIVSRRANHKTSKTYIQGGSYIYEDQFWSLSQVGSREVAIARCVNHSTNLELSSKP